MFKYKRHSGFTLIELSVVLIILGALTAMGLSASMGALESARRVATENRMAEIEKALFKFRETFDRLPCPGDPTLATTNVSYGLEAANSGTCTGGTPSVSTTNNAASGTNVPVPYGSVPTKTLNLPLDYMYDGWGRKFQYEVAPEMTFAGSFRISHPSSVCTDNGIVIRNEADSASITTGAVYALNSYGSNGLGAYLKSGSKYTSGTAGTLETYANRTSTTTPKYVYMAGTRGKLNTVGYYDDILHYKTRAELMNDDDRTKVWFRGPSVILAHTGTNANNWKAPKFICGRLSQNDSSAYITATYTPLTNYKFVGFTANNSRMLVYANSTCSLLPISVTGFGATSGAPTCSAGSTSFGLGKQRGWFTLNQTAAPYMTVWRYYNNAYTKIPNAIYPLLASTPEHVSISDDADFITASRSSATAYANLYRWDGAKFKKFNTSPSAAYTVYSNAISPDAHYYVATVVSGTDTIVHVWRNSNGTFNEFAATTPILGMTKPKKITFSPDSHYVAIAGNGASATTGLGMIAIDQLTDTASPVTISAQPDTTYDPVQVNFSPDNTFLLLTTGDTAIATEALLYRRTNATTYTQQTWPTLNGTGGDASTVGVFSR